MTDKEKVQLLELLENTASIFGKTITDGGFRLMADTLEKHEFTDVKNAIQSILRSSKFMPTLAEIVELVENTELARPPKTSGEMMTDEQWEKLKRESDVD